MNPFFITQTLFNFTTVHTIYTCVNNCLNSNIPEITFALKRLDVERQVRLIETLLADLDGSRLRTQSLRIGMENLEDCLKEINGDLGRIEKKIRDYKSSWIRVFSLNVDKELLSLETNLSILKDRFNTFSTISSITSSHRLCTDLSNSYYHSRS